MGHRDKRSSPAWATAFAVFALLLQTLLVGYMQTGGAVAAPGAHQLAAHHVHGSADGPIDRGTACCQDCIACGAGAMAAPPVPTAPEPAAVAVIVRAFADAEPWPPRSASHQARAPPIAA
jgi:hypothetical protein